MLTIIDANEGLTLIWQESIKLFTNLIKGLRIVWRHLVFQL